VGCGIGGFETRPGVEGGQSGGLYALSQDGERDEEGELREWIVKVVVRM
jgi:hypothetical protein